MKKHLHYLIATLLFALANFMGTTPAWADDTKPAAAPENPAVITSGYYSIKNNGNNQYVNVAGRKTVTFVGADEIATAPGTVIKVETDANGQVQVLRSQGVDVPGYAERAMAYVPKIVQLAVQKLHAEGTGTILGEHGLDAIMKKFNESFDYHLYTEQASGGVRIYGKTPSMQPVVDFYKDNKDNVDAKLPQLEEFINSAIQKVLEKTGGRGASILVPFKLHDVWTRMGGEASGLTEPVEGDDDAILEFYYQVLTDKNNVWNFAYQTAMIYWGNVKAHPRFEEMKAKLGEYAKYIDKVENINPDFKYYIVQKDNKIDFISEGNSELNADFTTWTLEPRSEFQVGFNEDNKLMGKYYTTLYTDFAYTVPTGVKAYKVTGISSAGVAARVKINGTIPAQTPVLLELEAETASSQTLTLDAEDTNAAPSDNILEGPDYLIEECQIKTAQVQMLFDLALELLGENGYNTYVKQYEHLMFRNSGTVNNKYFFGLDQADLKGAKDVRILNLNDAGENLGFYGNWTNMEANRAFIIGANNPVLLWLKGDINRDGSVTIADVKALVDIVVGKVTPEENPDDYDFDAAYVNEDEDITIADVTALVNIILSKEGQ